MTKMVHNPFRDRTMSAMFDHMLDAHQKKSRLLFVDDKPYSGNSLASFFWRGFNGIHTNQWDAASKKMVGYACWRAGQAAAKQ